MLVARGTTTPLVWDPVGAHGSGCWEPLRGRFNKRLDNIDVPFPDQTPMRVRAPHRTPSGWALPVVWGAGERSGREVFDPGTIAIDGTSFLVRSLTIKSQSVAVIERVTALHSTPKLANPEPRC